MKKDLCLYINTLDKSEIWVGLKKGGDFLDKISDQNGLGSQVLLPLIEKILKKNDLTFEDLASIEVETGPGSFTGIKVGVSVANALAFTLGIKVNNKKIETDLRY